MKELTRTIIIIKLNLTFNSESWSNAYEQNEETKNRKVSKKNWVANIDKYLADCTSPGPTGLGLGG